MLHSFKDTLRNSVEAATGGKVTVMFDDLGQPSYMVRIPKFNIEDVIADAGTGVHPAFIVDGVEKSEIWIGQHLATVLNGRACSLPGVDPATSIDFDTALGYCAAKGVGWHLITNAEWAAIALWCHKNGTLPTGNNNYGQDITLKHETAVRQDGLAPGEASGSARTLTGSGPRFWRHDGTFSGIADLVGNIGEWVGALRLDDGEIQIIPDNDAANNAVDQTDTSGLWKAIAAVDGALVAPGTAGSLKFDSVSVGTVGDVGEIQIDDVIDNSNDPGGDDDGFTYTTFDELAADAGITVPGIMKQLLLAPANSNFGDDKLKVRNYSERLPFRGGNWNSGVVAGVGGLFLHGNRQSTGPNIGFRPAFIA